MQEKEFNMAVWLTLEKNELFEIFIIVVLPLKKWIIIPLNIVFQ